MPFELRRDTVKLGNLLSIAEQIQAFGLGRKTGEIHITSVSPPARINIVEGAVVDAQFGSRAGLEAALALINLPGAESEFIVDERPARQTIEMPYMQLLFEAALVNDQTPPEKGPPVTESQFLASGQPFLKTTLGGQILLFPIAPGIVGVGRATVNEIVINDPTVSQRHAVLAYSGDGAFLKDLGSSNGTYVHGQRIKEQWLRPQDSLQFGSVQCLFVEGTRKALSAA